MRKVITETMPKLSLITPFYGSLYATIKKNYKFDNDPDIFASVIRPDIQPDIRFGHTNEQMRTKFGVDTNDTIYE